VAVTYVTSNTAQFTSATSVDISITPSGSDRVLIWWLTTNGDNAGECSGTFNGSSTGVVEHTDAAPAGAFQQIALYSLLMPANTTANATITWSTATDGAAGAIVYSGVSAVTGFNSASSAFAGSTTPTVDITSATGDKAVDFGGAIGSPASTTAGAGQTERVDFLNGDDFFLIWSSEEDGAATVTMSQTLNASGRWRQTGLSLTAAGGGGGGVKVPAFMLLGVR
jgi:hypothetical protein